MRMTPSEVRRGYQVTGQKNLELQAPFLVLSGPLPGPKPYSPREFRSRGAPLQPAQVVCLPGIPR